MSATLDNSQDDSENEEESSSSEEEVEDDFELDELDEQTDDTQVLKNRIASTKELNTKILRVLEKERKKVAKAKATIAHLISQIKLYKEALETEKAELEAEISQKSSDLEKERQVNSALKRSIQQLERDKQDLIKKISELEQVHEQALNDEEKLMAAMKKETYENLQTLMEELKRIEDSNEKLREEHEKTKLQIQEERAAHKSTLEQLVQERAKVEENKSTIETLKLTNDALLTQFKQLRRASVALKTSQSMRLSNSPPVERRSSAPALPIVEPGEPTLVGSNSNPGSNHSSRNPSPAPSPRHSVSKLYQLKRIAETETKIHSMSLVDHKYMWLGLESGAIQVWDTEYGHMAEQQVKCHSSVVSIIVPVEDKVWSYSHQDKSVGVWTSKKLSLQKRFNPSKDHHVNCIIEDHDHFVWLGCSDGTIRVWEPKSLKHKKDVSAGNNASVSAMCKSLLHVWAGLDTGAIQICSYTNYKVVKSLTAHSNRIESFTNVAPNEIWSSSVDKSIRCWNTESFDCLKVINLPMIQLSGINDKSHIVFNNLGTEAILTIWDPKTREYMEEISLSAKGTTGCLALDQKNRIWTATGSSLIMLTQ